MDVNERSEQWRLAMNVAYAPIAQTILVDKRHEQGFAAKISAIDPNLMTRRTWRFVDTGIRYDSSSSEGWMSSKLQYREDSPFVGWLKEQTASQRFDVAALRRALRSRHRRLEPQRTTGAGRRSDQIRRPWIPRQQRTAPGHRLHERTILGRTEKPARQGRTDVERRRPSKRTNVQRHQPAARRA